MSRFLDQIRKAKEARLRAAGKKQDAKGEPASPEGEEDVLVPESGAQRAEEPGADKAPNQELYPGDLDKKPAGATPREPKAEAPAPKDGGEDLYPAEIDRGPSAPPPPDAVPQAPPTAGGEDLFPSGMQEEIEQLKEEIRETANAEKERRAEAGDLLPESLGEKPLDMPAPQLPASQPTIPEMDARRTKPEKTKPEEAPIPEFVPKPKAEEPEAPTVPSIPAEEILKRPQAKKPEPETPAPPPVPSEELLALAAANEARGKVPAETPDKEAEELSRIVEQLEQRLAKAREPAPAKPQAAPKAQLPPKPEPIPEEIPVPGLEAAPTRTMMPTHAAKEADDSEAHEAAPAGKELFPNELDEGIVLPAAGIAPAASVLGRSGGRRQKGLLAGRRTAMTLTGPEADPQFTKRIAKIAPNPDRNVVSFYDPKNHVCEEYRLLGKNLLHSLPSDNGRGNLGKVVALTSSVRGEGKTLTSVNLALAMAQDFNDRVVLVDCDLRNPKVHSYMGTPSAAGLNDLLASPDPASILEDNLLRTDMGLHLLLAKVPGNSPAPILDSARMSEVLDMLRERYALVLIDTPPVLLATDALTLGVRSDGMLFLLRARKTQREQIQEARQRIARLNINLVGYVINNVKSFLPRIWSRYYYYYCNY